MGTLTSTGAVTCRICLHPERKAIDALLTAGASIAEIKRAYDAGHGNLSRHRQNHLGLGRPASRVKNALPRPVAARVNALIVATTKGTNQGNDLANEVKDLKKRAEALCTQAEVSNDPRTALMAIRELTRLVELQGRLAIEASAGRAADVTHHPIFLRFMGKLLQSLAQLPGAHEAVTALLERELGVRRPGG